MEFLYQVVKSGIGMISGLKRLKNIAENILPLLPSNSYSPTRWAIVDFIVRSYNMAAVSLAKQRFSADIIVITISGSHSDYDACGCLIPFAAFHIISSTTP